MNADICTVVYSIILYSIVLHCVLYNTLKLQWRNYRRNPGFISFLCESYEHKNNPFQLSSPTYWPPPKEAISPFYNLFSGIHDINALDCSVSYCIVLNCIEPYSTELYCIELVLYGIVRNCILL